MPLRPITVVIPVGPNPGNIQWLDECFASIVAQTDKPAEVLLIDDRGIGQHGPLLFHDTVWLGDALQRRLATSKSDEVGFRVRQWKTPWVSGVAHAFNFGIGLAEHDLVVQLGSDDRLEAWAIADCWRAWEKFKDPMGYYWMSVKYSTGETQAIPCHASMVPKTLWEATGGFPVESAVGAPDSIFISMMHAAKGARGNLREVKSRLGCPYWYRVHEGTDTARRMPRFQGVIHAVRAELSEQAIKT